MKRCNICKKTKEDDEFYILVEGKPGLSAYCKPCYCKKQKDLREKQKQVTVDLKNMTHQERMEHLRKIMHREF